MGCSHLSHWFLLLLYVFAEHPAWGTGHGTSLETQDAEGEGVVYTLVKDITVEEFEDQTYFFQEVVARYASFHCQKGKDNCLTDAEYIRANDVIVVFVAMSGPTDIAVDLYIQDYWDNSLPALTSYQLSEVFYHYADEIEDSFGYQVEVTWPIHTESGWEGWRIAVVTIISLIVLCTIIFGIWLAYDSKKKQEAMAQLKQRQHTKRLSAYDSLRLNDDKTGYATPYEHLQQQDDGSAASDGAPSQYTTMTTATVSATSTFDAGPEEEQQQQQHVYDNPALDPSPTGSKADEEEENEYLELTYL